MQFITALFGGTENTILNSAFVLGIVLVAIVLGLWGLKLLTRASSNMTRGKNRRLTIVDSARVDTKRQVVIIRRDNVEHVILTGGPQDLLIESGIPAPEPAAPTNRAAHRPVQARPAAAPAEDIAVPITPERPVPREAVDRLRDLARPAPLEPHPQATPLRKTGLLRREVIPMSPDRRVDNTAAAPSDSATSAAVDGTNGQLRLGSKGRFFRGVIRGDRT